jgi:lipopolysaccharide biosynthesis glycosyltransferase
MNVQQQKNSKTTSNRYPFLLKRVSSLCRAPKTILSFGCSTGEELFSIREVYKDAIIYGVDIRTSAVETARALTVNDSHIHVISHDQCAKLKFDLIFAISVLCRWPEVEDTPYSFDMFRSVTSELALSLVSKTGILVVYNSAYYVSDCLNPLLSETHLRMSTGHVKMYNEAMTVVYPRTTPVCVAWRHQPLSETFPTLSQPPPNVSETPPILSQATPTLNPLLVGILSYESKPSKNVGDYIQSLAQINMWSFFYNPKTWIIECIALKKVFEYFHKLHTTSGSFYRQSHTTYKNVKVMWVERDDIAELPFDEPIWIIMNGWFIHGHSWPPAQNIRPIFVSVHIAKDYLLTKPSSIAYFQKYQPIGCRDTKTRDRFQQVGISAYYSGCLTLTLDSVPKPHVLAMDVDMRQSGRRANVDVVYEQSMAELTKTKEIGIIAALQRLEEFSTAYSIRTSRLHCALPSLAVGVPCVDFCSPDGKQDLNWTGRDRFSAMDDGNTEQLFLRALVTASRIIEALDRLIVSGLSDRDVYHSLNMKGRFQQPYNSHESYTISDRGCDYLQVRKAYPSALVNLPSVYQVDSIAISNKISHIRTVRMSTFPHACSVVISFDENYALLSHAMVRSLSVNNPELLVHLHVLARDVKAKSRARFHQIIATMPNILIYWIPQDTAHPNYATPLDHVPVTCMDRLTIGEIEFPTTKVIYLDVDILVLGSILPLLSLNTGRLGISAKSSLRPVVKKWLMRQDDWDTGEKHLQYNHQKSFNAGVFVADVATLAENNFNGVINSLCTKYSYNDQIILNLYSKGQYTEMPAQYNVFSGQDDDRFTLASNLPNSIIVIHFAGSNKPWLSTYNGKGVYKELWDHYSKATDRVQSTKG